MTIPSTVRDIPCLVEQACERAGKAVARALNESGLWCELDFPFACHAALVATDLLTSELRRHGYHGQSLGLIKTMVEAEGSIYALYDASALTPSTATDLMTERYSGRFRLAQRR